MKTWSLADVFDVFKKIEQLTRPPRRDDGPTVERPDCSCGLGDGVKLREHWSSCAVWDDDQVEREAKGPVGEPSWIARIQELVDGPVGHPPPPNRAHGTTPGLDHPRLTETIANLRSCNLCGGHCNKACEQPNAFEPALTDDELVAVRGLLQERYIPAMRYDPTLGHVHRYMTGIAPEPDSPAASAAGVSPSEACDIPPSPSGGRSDLGELFAKGFDRAVHRLFDAGITSEQMKILRDEMASLVARLERNTKPQQ